MIKVTLNGKPFDPKTLEDAMVQAIADQVRANLGSTRHPETGEFPVIAITGDLGNLKATVEGSPELLELVKQKLAEGQEEQQPEPEPGRAQPAPTAGPKVFLSYGFDDRALAEKIAETLQANGIETWWAGWCISAGDSIRQRIDEGLAGCTHFVVLLTPRSVDKPWVNQEMDAGLVRKLTTGTKFIALRCDLASNQLPPLLHGLLSPSVNADVPDVSQLINDIYGIGRRPPLGPAPGAVAVSKAAETGFSPAATALAKWFVEATDYARKLEPNARFNELAARLELSADDLTDAVHELHGLATIHRHDLVYPEDELFVRFDKFWKPWDPAADALRLATELLNDDDFPNAPRQISTRFGWEPRRLNPALAFLFNRQLIRGLKAMNSGPWLLTHVAKTDATRRFVKSRQ